MRHPRLIIAGIGLAAVAAVGGVTAAAAAGGTSASSSTADHSAKAVTVHTASATVAGKTETILVNSDGLPLYFYRPDTAAKSFVTGAVAALWPPLTSVAPRPPEQAANSPWSTTPTATRSPTTATCFIPSSATTPAR